MINLFTKTKLFLCDSGMVLVRNENICKLNYSEVISGKFIKATHLVKIF